MPPRGWPRGVGVLIGALGLLLAGYAQAGFNQWTSYGPAGGAITALVIDPTTSSTLYAGTARTAYGDVGGVYKSTDGGQHWAAMNTSLTNATVTALVIDPTASSTLYAGIIGGGVYKSTDGGQHWAAMNTG